MTNQTTPRLRSLMPISVVGLLGLLAACNVVPPPEDDPTRYFVLSDPAPSAAPAAATAGVRVALGEVKLEGYLKKKEMIVRTGENEVEFRDFRRWAEPLDAAIARVLRLRLLEAPAVAQVLTAPAGPDQARDYDVTVDVRRCEGALDASGRYVASFSATFEVSTAGPDSRPVSRKVFTAPEASWDGKDFDRLASLLSADVSALGQEIAASIPPRD